METSLSRHWHHLPEAEIIDLLETDLESGLDVFEVEDRQERFGPNSITERQGHGPLVRFVLEFRQPLLLILLAAAVIMGVLQEWVDAAVILAVVVVTAFIGFFQESKALNAIEALAKELSSEATVMRAGQRARIAATGLVPGDVVLLRSGDKVPADLRLLRSRDLHADESALTGESVPVEKNTMVLDHDTGLADRRNMVFSSTLVTHGTATGVAVGTGDDTEIGRISELISTTDVLATPLTRKITEFSRILLFVILGMAAVTFVVGIIRGEDWLEMFMAAVALSVGAIPEGLPAAVTITLAIGVSRMAKRHTIIRHLPAVETLGSTTVICSDKTGTLTQNQMTVREVFARDELFAVSGVGYAPEGSVSHDGVMVDAASNVTLIECLKAGSLCNDSALQQTTEGWQAEGDPTEAALLVSARKAGLDPESLDRALPRLDAIPFESQQQYMATLHKMGDGEAPVAYVKGSVESVLQRCGDVFSGAGGAVTIDTHALNQRVGQMASSGLRVLAFARVQLPLGATSIGHQDVASGLSFVGLQGMIDPPRTEAIRSVAVCQAAGIEVKMITGDHAGTAAAVAGQLGLAGADPDGGIDEVLTGAELAELSDTELIEAAEGTAVFARVAPEQKLRLVEALQHRGHIVAMTGDGVNDAPALRRSDIGAAMGITGTEVSKEAADMVITDDNFASIQAAVEEGRGVFANLTKFITWTLPTNVGEGLVIMAAVLVGAALPILPVQILWVNMTTALLLGLMLAFEPKEPGIMLRPPRDPASPILSRALITRIVLVGVMLMIGAFALFEWELSQGASEASARTAAVGVFVFGELFYLFNCRSLTRSMFSVGVFSNRWLLAGVGIMIALQLAFTYLPIMNRIFHSEPIGLTQWALILGIGLVIYLIVEVEKWVRRRGSRTEAHEVRQRAS